MKNRAHAPSAPYQPSEDAIREKALELYMRSGWIQGRDLDNWLEAEAYLIANPPEPVKESPHHEHAWPGRPQVPAEHSHA